VKKFFLFAFDGYCELGGINDYQGAYNTLTEALAAAKTSGKEYFHVAELQAEGLKPVKAGKCNSAL
jgi:hypothetical protein